MLIHSTKHTVYGTCRSQSDRYSGLVPVEALIFAGLFTTGQVLASEALEEIVVTAQKHEQGVNDIGITVNAFTGEQLKDLGVFSTEQVAQFTPGLTVNESAAPT